MLEFVLGFFNFGNLFLVVGLGLAVAALFYVPLPLTHYVVDILLVIAFTGKVYFVGYDGAERYYKAKLAAQDAQFVANMAKISAESEKAVIAATEKVKAADDANVAALKKALDEQAVVVAAAQENYARAIAAIDSAPPTADSPVDPVILNAIRGAK